MNDLLASSNSQHDEPIGNLDSETGKHIFKLLMSLNETRQKTVVVVTGIAFKYFFIAVTSFISIMLIYELLVSRINVLRFL